MPWDEGTGITPHWGLGAAAASGWRVAQGCILLRACTWESVLQQHCMIRARPITKHSSRGS